MPPFFWKNVGIVLAGAIGAQALPLLVAPLLTRVCTPAEMGSFSLWLGVVAVMSIGVTLRFEAVIVLDHGREQQRLCFSIVTYCATVLAVVLTLLLSVARLLELPLVRAMSWSELLTIGAATWLTASMQTMLGYAASHKLFGKAALSKVVQAGAIAACQLALLYTGFDSTALLAGQLIGLGTGLWAARLLLCPPLAPPRLVFDSEQRDYLVKHRAFWRFALPSSLLNTIVGQLPLFLVGWRHGALAAGLYALTQRVISAPVSLIAASVLDVFKREAAHEFRSMGHCRNAYRSTFKVLVWLALGPSLILLLYSPELFSWVFGEAWRPAGELASILAPLSFLNFLASPLSYVFLVTGRQKQELLWQLALFALTLVVFSVPLTLHQNVLAYAAGRSALYIVYLCMSYRSAQHAQARAPGRPSRQESP